MKRVMVLSGLLAVVFAALLVCAGTSGASSGWNLTLRWTPDTVVPGSGVAFTGVLTDTGVGVSGDYIEVDEFDTPDCSVDAYWDTAWYGTTLTDANGFYSVGPVEGSKLLTGGTGHYFVQAYAFDFGSNSWVAATECLPLNPVSSQVNHEFLCYSKWQVQPSVWPWSDATTLLALGYWLPTAVDGNIAGGTNLGNYNLQCNVAPKGDGYVGAGGEWWPGNWATAAATGGGLYPH